MYTPLSREIMEPIAETLAAAILEQTGPANRLKDMPLVSGEADYNILTDVVLRELRNYMSDAFMTAYLFDNSEYHRVRQREGEERERVRKENAQIHDNLYDWLYPQFS